MIKGSFWESISPLSMEPEVTFIDNLNLLKDSWNIKVRIIRLWKQADFKNPTETYSIEMVLIDEKGTKVQANVLKKWIPRFEHSLREDVVGEIVTCGKIDTPVNQQPRIMMEIQDLEGVKLTVTLWETFAQQLSDYVTNLTLKGRVIIAIQFAKFKFFKGRAYVSNSYTVSRLFINSEIDEIKKFKSSLLSNVGDDSNHSLTFRSFRSSKSCSIHDDFLVNNELKDIVDVMEISEIRSCIIVGTIKGIPKDIPWYYLGCRNCHRKVQTKKSITPKGDGSGQVEQTDVFECDRCTTDVIDVLPRFKIPLRVQDSTGLVTLTLFDRDAKKLLHKSAYELCEKNLQIIDMDFFPEELNDLLEKRFAFKIDIAYYNLRTNSHVFGVSNVTNDEDIMIELQKKANLNLNQPKESESLHLGLSDLQSQQNSYLKDAVSHTGDNTTPSTIEKSTAESPSPKNKDKNTTSTHGELKRKLEDVYGDADAAKMSTTKKVEPSTISNIPIPKKAEVIAACKRNLLVPKKEK